MTIAQRRKTAGALRLSTTPGSTPVSLISDSPVSAPPIESEKTLRARYAANQRHSKAKQARKESHQNESIGEAETKAAERKQRHREKNKIAAAKCRSRQRKQVQTIQDKGSLLEEKNLKLKTMIQELRGELNTLRSMALDHQQCNCSVARYNHNQAERVVAEYRSSCLGQAPAQGMFSHLSQQRGFQTQWLEAVTPKAKNDFTNNESYDLYHYIYQMRTEFSHRSRYFALPKARSRVFQSP
jgi:hypothetical protein